MKIVKSIIILLALIFQVQYAIAQSSGVKKTAGCCFTLTTFKADGSLPVSYTHLTLPTKA